MIWFIAVAVIAVIVFIANWIQGDFWDGFFGALGTLFFGGIAAFFVAAVVSGFGVGDQNEMASSTPLANLADGSQTEGSFFLGSGTIDETQVYSYYYLISGTTNQYARDYQDASNSVIVQDSSSPRVEEWHKVSHSIWTLPMPHDTTYYFHVPAGSIKEGVQLDNKN